MHVCLCAMCVLVLVEASSLRTEVTDGCDPPCGCWELNPDPLEEQPVLLTAELFLSPWQLLFYRLF